MHTDADGRAEWNVTLPASLDTLGDSLIQASDGGYAVAGTTQNGISLTKIAPESVVATPSPSIPEFPTRIAFPSIFLVTAFVALALAGRKKQTGRCP